MKKNPAVRSMLTIALYLVLLIGMWSVIGKWVYPTVTDRSRAEELAKKQRAVGGHRRNRDRSIAV